MSILRPIQSANMPANKVEIDAAQQHGRNNERKLLSVEPRGGFQVRQRPGDDAHVDPVQQAAQSRDEQQKADGPDLVDSFGTPAAA